MTPYQDCIILFSTRRMLRKYIMEIQRLDRRWYARILYQERSQRFARPMRRRMRETRRLLFCHNVGSRELLLDDHNITRGVSDGDAGWPFRSRNRIVHRSESLPECLQAMRSAKVWVIEYSEGVLPDEGYATGGAELCFVDCLGLVVLWCVIGYSTGYVSP